LGGERKECHRGKKKKVKKRESGEMDRPGKKKDESSKPLGFFNPEGGGGTKNGGGKDRGKGVDQKNTKRVWGGGQKKKKNKTFDGPPQKNPPHQMGGGLDRVGKAKKKKKGQNTRKKKKIGEFRNPEDVGNCRVHKKKQRHVGNWEGKRNRGKKRGNRSGP